MADNLASVKTRMNIALKAVDSTWRSHPWGSLESTHFVSFAAKRWLKQPMLHVDKQVALLLGLVSCLLVANSYWQRSFDSQVTLGLLKRWQTFGVHRTFHLLASAPHELAGLP